MRLPWKGPKRFDAPVYDFHAGRTLRRRKGLDAAVTNEAGVDIEYFQQLFLGLTLRRNPYRSEDPGEYQSRGWEGSIGAKGPGFLPRVNIEAPLKDSRVRSRVDVYWTSVTHEERLAVPLSPSVFQWTGLGDSALGVGYRVSFQEKTALRFRFDSHNYDKNVDVLLRRGDFFLPAQVRAAVSPELLHGFLARSFRAGFDQPLVRWAALAGDWRRHSYESSAGSRWANDFEGRLIFRFGGLSLHAGYRRFKPHRTEGTEYMGAGFQWRP